MVNHDVDFHTAIQKDVIALSKHNFQQAEDMPLPQIQSEQLLKMYLIHYEGGSMGW